MKEGAAIAGRVKGMAESSNGATESCVSTVGLSRSQCVAVRRAWLQ